MEAVLMEAKTMGNYLIYDLVDKEFGTDINGMADYFFGGGNQMLWPADDMTLIIGIDTELSAEDDIYEASRVRTASSMDQGLYFQWPGQSDGMDHFTGVSDFGNRTPHR